MQIELSPKRVAAGLFFAIGLLFVAHILALFSTHVLDHGSVFGLVRLFDLLFEENVPTLYSSIQLIFASALLARIGFTHRSNGEFYRLWLFLSMVFLFLAIDETAQFHERLIDPVREKLELSGLFYYAWIVPYGLAGLALLLAYTKFLLRLPRTIAKSFILAGLIYVSGAIGFEMLGGWQMALHGSFTPAYIVFYTCEEMLEMIGIALFIYALLRYITITFQQLRITLAD